MTDPARRQALRDTAQRFYVTQLGRDPVARRYLTQRGIGPALARRLQLGAAPGRWTTVCDLLRRRGYTDEELLAAGVGFCTSKGRLVDVFRSRVLFPQHDEHGHLVGWAGRATPDAAPHAPRWLNSSAGDYRKSELLDGLHEGRARLAAGAIPVLCGGGARRPRDHTGHRW